MRLNFYEQISETIHRNEKLGKWYDSLANPTEVLVAMRTVRYIMDNFPQTRQELLGTKIYESEGKIRRA